jgi:hypothetical protein
MGSIRNLPGLREYDHPTNFLKSTDGFGDLKLRSATSDP